MISKFTPDYTQLGLLVVWEHWLGAVGQAREGMGHEGHICCLHYCNDNRRISLNAQSLP